MSQQHDVRNATRSGWEIPPRVLFAIAVGVCFVVCGLSKALLPAELVMPLVVTALLVCAAAIGVVAWRRSGDDRNDVTCADAAGALVLIGAVTAAATIEPQQLVRLVAG
jgi:hypothetical protein